ncbi:hypothetical protein DH2020_046968 [Rehmannia glutinosa]|uniref:Transposase-associated domain-containing protein n=1 Tax=Rehmannia glutinosa TaxID=99300 RepID=A0ABR0UAQ3_REHGL
MNRNWIMNLNRVAPEYINGLNGFLKLAENYMRNEDLSKIHCPCRKCRNLYKFDLNYVRGHLYTCGFDKSYKVWIFHGEVSGPSNCASPTNEVEHVDDFEEDDTFFDMLNELRDAEVAGNSEIRSDDYIQNTTGEQFGEHYMAMFDEAQRELYAGCKKFSAFSFLVKLMHVKVLNGWSNKSFDMLLKLLEKAFPKPNAIPSSYYEAKKMLRELGLGYESIHACKNDCILFRNEHNSNDTCPVCKEPRYKYDEAKKNKIPQKVLRYFPLKPRLKKANTCSG